MTNYWTQEMLAKDYHLGNRREAAMIARENSGHDIMTCGQCRGEAHYKNTIGTHKCIACGSLWLSGTGRWSD